MRHVFIGVILCFLCSAALATESIDCIGEEYSVAVVVNLSDGSFGGYHLFNDGSMVSSGWSKEPPILDIENRKVVLVAEDKNKKLSWRLETFENGTGALLLNDKQYPLRCDWSAFEL